jgi:hypothetical protein
MNNQKCLEQAMFAASESYSHTSYIFGDCGRVDSSEDEDSEAIRAMRMVTFSEAA